MLDPSIWTGVLMLSGAVGATLMIDRDPVDEDDPAPAVPDLAAHLPTAQTQTDPDHDIAAHRDTLAWFLEGEDGPGNLPGADVTADGTDTPAHGDDLEIPLDDTGPVPLIEGFEPGGHMLELVYTPASDPTTGESLVPALSIAATEDGSGSIISLDGTAVAELAGVTSLSPGDIALVPDHLPQAQAAA